jgi:hypothetical protein
MNFGRKDRSAANIAGPVPRLQLYSERSRARGYAYEYKRVVLAYLVESVIVLASLYGAWLFAKQYAHTDEQRQMMMLAPIAYGLVEFCRVPIALSIRKPNNFFFKLILLVGLLGAACVTIKSVSQLGEIMFRPRLTDVVEAKKDLTDAESGVTQIDQQIKVADALVEQRRQELVADEKQLHDNLASLAALPKQDCSPTYWTDRFGAHRSQRCTADSRIGPINQNIVLATHNRDAANKALDQANDAAKIDRRPAEDTRRHAWLAYREAVMNSQLHSFTAMWYGKEPTEVTDGEIHTFLRIFVFIPAIGAAFAATFIALTAVIRIKPDEPTIVEVPDSNSVLGPFAEQILREATIQTVHDTQEAVHRAQQAAAMPVIVTR